jgi:hypothetical protein
MMQHIFATLIAKKLFPLQRSLSLESTSPSIFASIYLSNTSLSLPKHKLKLEVPLRYLSIHFITS